MTYEEERKMRDELEAELNAEPEIQPGDVVVLNDGWTKATIDKLYYSFRCVEWHTERKEFVKYYDIEFVDTKGNYRHWKSYFDGGYIQYKER